MKENRTYLEQLGLQAKDASVILNRTGQNDKNKALLKVAIALVEHQDELLQANAIDVNKAIENGVKESLIDRLRLTPDRISGMSEGLQHIISLVDIVGEVVSM